MGNWKKQLHIIVLGVLVAAVLIMQIALLNQVNETIEARSDFMWKVQDKISKANSLVASENVNRANANEKIEEGRVTDE